MHRLFRCAAGIALVVTIASQAARAETTGVIGVSVEANPLAIDLKLLSTEVRVGQWTQARVMLTNHGDRVLERVAVALRTDPTGLRVRPDGPRTISKIRGGRTASVQWSVCASEAGAYVLLAQAAGLGVTADSPAIVLTAVPHRGRDC